MSTKTSFAPISTDAVIAQPTASFGDVITNKAGLSGSIPEVLGAIGIGVLLLGGTVFGVIAGLNFSNDTTAKSNLDAVKSGQTLVQVEQGAFKTKAQLTAGDAPAVTIAEGNWDVSVNADGTDYCAVSKSKSASGKLFYVQGKDGKITETAPTPEALGAGLTCPTID